MYGLYDSTHAHGLEMRDFGIVMPNSFPLFCLFVALQASLYGDSEATATLRLEVRDSGSGMGEEATAKLKTEFEEVDNEGG